MIQFELLLASDGQITAQMLSLMESEQRRWRGSQRSDRAHCVCDCVRVGLLTETNWCY